MIRLSLLIAACSILIGVTPALAQGAGWAQTGGSGDSGSSWDNAPTSDITMTQGNSQGNFFTQPPSNTTTARTRQNSYQGVLSRLPAANASPFNSQTASGMPIPGTFIAPANLALQTQGAAPVLPITNLDSFVAQSGYNDMIYGDEGTDGPPPYDSFETIGSGISSGALTTGHQSDCPSAWY
ncbi:MAG TPA: hypothetical protein V6D22_15885 [Candidatus Obscuribacterales bacterium]